MLVGMAVSVPNVLFSIGTAGVFGCFLGYLTPENQTPDDDWAGGIIGTGVIGASAGTTILTLINFKRTVSFVSYKRIDCRRIIRYYSRRTM